MTALFALVALTALLTRDWTLTIGVAALTGTLLLWYEEPFGWWLFALAFGLALFRYVLKRLPTP